jgi:hypothetical protein
VEREYMQFTHEVIDDEPPCGRLFICQPTDLTGNGRPDLIVGGLGAEELPLLKTSGVPLVGRLLRRLETNVFWYENPGWERHDSSTKANHYVLGNALGDVTGNGRLDLLVGQGIGGQDIYWFEQPKDPRQPWKQHLVGSDFDKYHDLAFGDVDDDGDPELVGVSQQSETVFYYDVPDDPTQSPWPPECLHIIAENTYAEGLEIVDIDGDGHNELLAGTNIYRRRVAPTGTAQSETERRRTDVAQTNGGTQIQEPSGDSQPGVETTEEWRVTSVASGWEYTRVAAGDIDDDGELELVFTEGDLPELGDRMGRVGWFDPPDWEPHVLRDDLFCPHSVQLADFDGNGHLDIYVAEMGLGEHDADATHLVFRNLGEGEFEETVVHTGTPTHDAKAVDIDGDGRIDILGKSYEPNAHVDAWYNREA